MRTRWLLRAGTCIALLIGGIVIVEEASRGAPGMQRAIGSHLSAKTISALPHDPPQPADPVALANRILSRPLFALGRRPFTAAVTDAAPDAAAPELRLVGIVFFSGAKRALMAVPGNDKAILAGPGSKVAGRTIRAIDKNRVVLSGPNGSETIMMTPMRSSSGAAPNAAPRPNVSP